MRDTDTATHLGIVVALAARDSLIEHGISVSPCALVCVLRSHFPKSHHLHLEGRQIGGLLLSVDAARLLNRTPLLIWIKVRMRRGGLKFC